jgi:hypothetical protein
LRRARWSAAVVQFILAGCTGKSKGENKNKSKGKVKGVGQECPTHMGGGTIGH